MNEARYQMPDAGCRMPGSEPQLSAEAQADLEHDLELVEEADAGMALREGKPAVGYRDLRVWQIARPLSIEIHRLTLEMLPRFELHEEGSQIRRSAKSVRTNIVEGFGRRRYRMDFIKFLVYSEASCDETTDHLDTLFETGSLTDRPLYDSLRVRLVELGKRLNRFIAAVEQHPESPK